jgi:hypothetical protein
MRRGLRRSCALLAGPRARGAPPGPAPVRLAPLEPPGPTVAEVRATIARGRQLAPPRRPPRTAL